MALVRRQARIVFAACAALASLCASHVSVMADAIDTSIAEVNDDPARFHQKTIRLRGVVDECWSLSCEICEPAGTVNILDKDNCMSVRFSPHEPYYDPTDIRSRAREIATDIYEQLYRFSEVTVEGPYDAKCSLNYDPAELSLPKAERHEIICVDRSLALTVERVLTVHKRASAASGRFDTYPSDNLVPLPASEAASLLAAYREHLRSWRVDEAEGATYRSFEDSTLAAGDALLCRCLDDSCEGRWPTEAGQTYQKSPADPYSCTTARKFDGKWTFWGD